MKHKTKKLGIILCSVGIAVIVVFSVFLNYLALTTFDTLFRQFFKTSEDKVVSSESAGEVNVDYYESDFKDAAALYDYEERKVAEMAMEGATLLENDGLLPLAKGTELSLFSHSSVDLVSGGSGSGSGSFELTADLKTGLEAAGLEVNETLWNFYKSGNGSGYKRGAGSIEYGRRLDWKINECPRGKDNGGKRPCRYLQGHGGDVRNVAHGRRGCRPCKGHEGLTAANRGSITSNRTRPRWAS